MAMMMMMRVVAERETVIRLASQALVSRSLFTCGWVAWRGWGREGRGLGKGRRMQLSVRGKTRIIIENQPQVLPALPPDVVPCGGT